MNKTVSQSNISLTSVCLLLGFVTLFGCGGGKKSKPIVVGDVKSIESAPDVDATAGDWPWWRGPNNNSIATLEQPIEDISATLNLDGIRWKIPVPGRGHASPIVVGTQVIIATADESARTMSLISYNNEDGGEQWNTQLHRGKFMRTHSKNSHASQTPASDGKHIYTASMIDDGIQVAAVSLDGKIKWSTTAGAFQSRHGYGSSPCIYKSLVIVSGDHGGGSWLAALDRESGDIVWRVNRSGDTSFATPILAKVKGTDQILLSGHRKLISYHPASGEILWQSKGTSPTTANTCAWNDELVFTSGGYPDTGLMAVNVEAPHVVAWEDNMKQYVPSPLVLGDKLIATQDTGIVHCFKADSGEKLWKARLDGDCSGSPVAVGDTILQLTEKGVLHAYKHDPEFDEIVKLQLEGIGMSTPVVCDSGIFIRTSKWLYCFEAK